MIKADLILVIRALQGWWYISSTNVIGILPPSSHLAHPFSDNMTIVSNDPIWWPVINANIIAGYFAVAAFIGLTYDWALTFGQEVELVWRQRWSLMTVMYLSVRYLGILYAIMNMLVSIPTISVTDAGCQILYFALNWTNTVVFPVLCVIMIFRLYAMYQRSRRILIFLVIIFLAVNIFYGVATVMSTRQFSGEELILSGTYTCSIDLGEEHLILDVVIWILGTMWEVLIMCLAIWIAVKHFRELRQYSAGGIIGDCFKVLIKTHVVYFVSFVAVACAHLVSSLSSIFLADGLFLGTQLFSGFLQIFSLVQMFVLGPRLILGVREYYAELVADSDTATGMTSIAFQEHVHISTDSSV